MTLREHMWEFTVNAASWVIASGFIVVLVVVFGLYDVFKARRNKVKS